MSIASANDATTLDAGSTLQMSVDVQPSTASDKVYWSVYGDCASINDNGVLTAIKAGNVTVIAKAADGSLKDATKTITITDTTAPTVTGITVEYTDGTTATGTDCLFCKQGQVVKSIKVTMSEPVQDPDNAEVSMIGTEGDCATKIPSEVTYGTMALDPNDATTIVITPYEGNKTAGYVGEMNFSVASGAVKDLSDIDCTATSFYLEVGLPFTDVTTNDWFFNALAYTSARGIVLGVDQNSAVAVPNANVTRGQFLVMLMRSLNIDPETDWTDNFSDAGTNEYYSGYLAKAKELEIVNGVGNNMFAPNANITRQDMVTMMYNALYMSPKNVKLNDLSAFTDRGSIANYAYYPFQVFVTRGVIAGEGNNMLCPQNLATRAEAAQMLYKLLNDIDY